MSNGDKIRITTQEGQRTQGTVSAMYGDRIQVSHRPKWVAGGTMISKTEYILTEDDEWCSTDGDLVTIETMEPARPQTQEPA